MSVLEEVDVPLSAEGEACSLDSYLVLPDNSMDERIAAARRALGKTTILLGHHYQRDEVIRFADFTGDSYKLSKAAAETDANFILFCGVHFMAESADVLAHEGQQVILPDLNAGCSMADMAEIGQVEECWETLLRRGRERERNSAAHLYEFLGGDQGLLRRTGRAGVHLVERAPGVRVGVCAREEDSLPARSASGPQHRPCHGHSADGNGGLRSVADWRRHYAGAAARGEGRSVEGTLLGAPAVPAGARGQGAGEVSRGFR